MIRVGITGAAGYIGSGLCSELQKEYDVIPIDNFSNGQIQKIHGMKIIKADIRERRELSPLLDADVIIHLAAISDIGMCQQNRVLAFEVNVIGTQNIAFICYQKGIPLIFASSMAVFGHTEYTPVDEEHPRNPPTFYGLTKVLGERTIAVFSKGNFPSYVLIKSNVYGVHQVEGVTIKKETVINRFVEKALKNEDITVYEPGMQSKNFLHVADAVAVYRRAVEKIVDEKEKETEFFCVGGSESITILELGQLIEGLARRRGYHPSVVMVENPRKESPTHFSVAVSKIQRELQFSPRYTLEKGITEMF